LGKEEMTSTLLLTRDYMPLKIISWERAITLLMLDKVEVIEDHDSEVRSATVVMKIPAIVRLVNSFKRNKNLKVRFSRINVFARDNYKCQYCAKRFKICDLTLDHVLPRAQGGATKWDNVCASCYACNLKKGNRTPEQAQMKLPKVPVEPKYVSAFVFNIPGKTFHDSWKQYLTETIDE
jgi:5-methylcytosine-specific restriction endonuclease McrA